jgi:hypothetical protein
MKPNKNKKLLKGKLSRTTRDAIGVKINVELQMEKK